MEQSPRETVNASTISCFVFSATVWIQQRSMHGTKVVYMMYLEGVLVLAANSCIYLTWRLRLMLVKRQFSYFKGGRGRESY